MVLNVAAVVTLVFFLQYGACVAFYHANERRAMADLITKSIRVRVALTMCAWCLLVLSVFLCASLQGWERGVPVWLCLISVAGFVSLYVSAYKSLIHIKSGVAALAVSFILGIGLILVDTSEIDAHGEIYHGSKQSITETSAI